MGFSKRILPFISAMFLTFSAFSYEYERFVLQNGLEIYSVQEKNSTSCTVYYLSKAGYSCQTEENAGFFKMYSNIFWNDSKTLKYRQKEFMLTEISSNVNQNQSTYSFSTNSKYLFPSVEMLSKMLANTDFSDENLSIQLKAAREENQELLKRAESYLTGAIDSRVFSSYPWKLQSYLNVKNLNSTGIEKARSIMLSIQKNYYTPNASAVVIVSPYSGNEILAMSKKYFESWKSTVISVNPETESKFDKSKKNQKYVIISDEISSEINQIVVQYAQPDFFSNEKNIIASQMAQLCMEHERSNLKNFLTGQEKLGIIGSEYINAGFSSQGKFSRLIFQSLFSAELANPAEQAKIFMSGIDCSRKFSTEEINQAKRLMVSQEKLSSDSAKLFANNIVQKWAYRNTENFSKIEDIILSIGEKEMLEVFKLEPHVFLVVNPKVYKKYQQELSNNGWQTVTRENAFLYGINTNSENRNKPVSIPDEEELSERIIKNIRQNSGNFKLSNGIPVNYSLNPDSSTVTIVLQYEGGEARFGSQKRAMETILLKTLARTIEDQIIKAWQSGEILDTGSVEADARIYDGRIIITCTSQDFETVCQCINSAFSHEKITPYLEDEIISEEKSKWYYFSNQLDFQLKCKALTAFYKNSGLDYLFNCSNDILQGISYDEILQLYRQNYNAKRISVIVTGNPVLKKEKSLESTMNSTLSILRQSEFKKTKRYKAEFAELTQISKLKRIDIPKFALGNSTMQLQKPGSATEVRDPAIVIIECPKRGTTEYIQFMLVFTCLVQSINDDFEKQGEKQLAESVSVFDFEEIDGFIGLQFEKIKCVKDLYRYFAQKCFSFSRTQMTEERFEKSKTILETQLFAPLENSVEFAKQISYYKTSGMPALYNLDLYSQTQRLTYIEILPVYSEYLIKPRVYWIFSADSYQGE